jgi:putative hydrolase of the HAD superfamily
MNQILPSTLAEEEVMRIKTWVFDLDNTLYPASSRLFDQIDKNITHFIMGNLDLDWDAAYKIQKSYFREHGTSMRGMMTNHGTDPAEFLEAVHEIDLSAIPANPNLSDALGKLPGRKVIFTNGSTDHADNVTRHLGIDHHFDATFDIVDSDYTPKPDLGVYNKMIMDLDIDPSSAIMFEDMARNLIPAAEMGMTTVWVRTDVHWGIEGSEGDHIDHVVDDLAGWLGALPHTRSSY